MNFDRIAHLVKLVFSTRIVAISLVDGTEEYVQFVEGFSERSLIFYIGFSNQNVGLSHRTLHTYVLIFLACSWVWCAQHATHFLVQCPRHLTTVSCLIECVACTS